MAGTVGTHGQAAADDLPKGGQVGRDPAKVAEAPFLETEAADDLVKHQQGAVLVAQATQPLEEGRSLNQQPVVWQRLDDHGGDVVAVFAEQVLHGLEVVKRADQGRGHGVLRDAGAAGDAEGGQTAARGHHQGIDVTVVAPLKLHQHVPTGVPSGQSNGAHHRLRARGNKADFVHVREALFDPLGQFNFTEVGGLRRTFR